MAVPETPISFWPRPMLLVLYLIGSLLFVAVSAWMIDGGLLGGRLMGTPEEFFRGSRSYSLLVAIPFGCIFVVCAAFYADRLLRPRPSLTLTTDGMGIYFWLGRTRFIRWDDISAISVFDYPHMRGQGLGILLRDDCLQQFDRRGRKNAKANLHWVGYYLIVHKALVSEPLENVRDTMQRFLERSRQPQAPAAHGRTNR
ncbi:MAG TPA: STM3941 family protein [Afifellaceae bacterium]|nr:STM3941 family protein [Afifellaceae bacterium]